MEKWDDVFRGEQNDGEDSEDEEGESSVFCSLSLFLVLVLNVLIAYKTRPEAG